MSALKEPKRISLVEGLNLLERHLSTEEAKTRLRQAFVRKAFRQEPSFALSYDEAEIDWAAGLVKIPRKRDRFCPTFPRAEFNAYFFEEQPGRTRGGGIANDEITEEGRRARFEQWEKLGVDAVKQDLATGGSQIRKARTWGPYGLGPIAIPFMWNATGRAAGSVFIGEKSSKEAAAELYDAIAKELAKSQH